MGSKRAVALFPRSCRALQRLGALAAGVVVAASAGCAGLPEGKGSQPAQELLRRARSRLDVLQARSFSGDEAFRRLATAAARRARDAARRGEEERAGAALSLAEAAEQAARAEALRQRLERLLVRLHAGLEAARARQEDLAERLGETPPPRPRIPRISRSRPSAPEQAARQRAQEARQRALRADEAAVREDLLAAAHIWERVARCHRAIARLRRERAAAEHLLEAEAAEAGRLLRAFAERQERTGRAQAARIALQEAAEASRLATRRVSASAAAITEAADVLLARAELCLLLSQRAGAPATERERLSHALQEARNARGFDRLRAADRAHRAAMALLLHARNAAGQHPPPQASHRHALAVGLDAAWTERGVEVRWPPRAVRGAALRRFAERIASWLQGHRGQGTLLWAAHPRPSRLRRRLARLAEALRAAGIEDVSVRLVRSRRADGPLLVLPFHTVVPKSSE